MQLIFHSQMKLLPPSLYNTGNINSRYPACHTFQDS